VVTGRGDMTGNNDNDAAATWRRDAAVIYASMMQNDHSRAQFCLET
jgi:hypothetical protein